MIGKTVSRYQILEKLGEGGMGVVYLAEDTELNRKVALKFLSEDYAGDEELLARFKQEAQTAAGLHHPNIITIYEVGQYEDRPYIAMAYIEGETLGEVIAHGDLGVDAMVDLALQMAGGLAAAHDAGVVHRDVKPDNIFIDREGRVQILDFGLAKLAGVGRITGPTSTFGTIYFMSPEQVRGEAVDHRSDIFSFGTVLYEMLTGALPFKGDHPASIIYSITNEDPAPPSTVNRAVPPALDAVLLKALAKSPHERYQSAGELAEALNRFRQGEQPARPARPRHLMRYVVPTSVVFLSILAVSLFKPFKVEISPDQQAVAAEASLAIMYFDNVVDPEDPKRLGEIITNLLITGLSESEYMEVVSSQRLYDILKLQGREGEKRIDQSTASAVAAHAGAKWMLLGKVLQEEPAFVVTSQLVDVKTGRVVASQRIVGGDGETIFGLVDRLTTEITSDLTLPEEGASDMSVAEATTYSTEAYRWYLEGMENLNKYYGPEARECFTRAIELDSTFAMAYMRMATGLVSPNRIEQRRAIERALKYSEHVTGKERVYIQSFDARIRGNDEEAVSLLQRVIKEHPNEKDAYKALGDIYRGPLNDIDKAIAYYRKAIEIDPLDKFSYNVLAYSYQAIGDIDNYVWAIYQYISLAPDEANPYDSRGDLYAFGGKIDKAIRSYQEALSRKRDFYPSLIKLGQMYVFKQEYDKAAEVFAMIVDATDQTTRSTGRVLLALIPSHQGRWQEALKVLEKGRRFDSAEGYDRGRYVELEACIYRDTDRYDEALKLVEKELAQYREENPGDKLTGREAEIQFQAMAGKLVEARKALAVYKRDLEAAGETRLDDYYFAEATVELAAGNPVAACESFDSITRRGPHFLFDYYRGVAYVRAQRYHEAVQLLDEVTTRFSEDRARQPTLSVSAYYYLGLAYEESGRPRKALEHYATFLDIWKNADDGTPYVEDARSRLQALEHAGIES